MTKTLQADKKSCRKLHDKGMLAEDAMCQHCSKLHAKNYSSSFLAEQVSPFSQPSGNSDEQASNISTNSSRTLAKRNRAEPERYIGSPGGGSLMLNKRTVHGCHVAAQKQKRTALRLISKSKNDNKIDRAVAQHLASMSNGNKENVPIELPRGGTSRSANFQAPATGWSYHGQACKYVEQASKDSARNCPRRGLRVL
jgi:hypothetical protein